MDANSNLPLLLLKEDEVLWELQGMAAISPEELGDHSYVVLATGQEEVVEYPSTRKWKNRKKWYRNTRNIRKYNIRMTKWP